MKKINVGVIGATGLVGREIIKCLEELNDNRINVYAYASSKSIGEIINTEKKNYKVEELNEETFEMLDYAIFSGSSEVSEKYCLKAVEKGCTVIDNSSYFRMNKEVPLVSIGSNDKEIYNHKGIIANPNCSTIILARSIKIIDELFGVKKVIVSTYQSVSGIGKEALEEYGLNQYINLPMYHSFPYVKSKVHYSIKDNIIPQIDEFNISNGFSKEEMKMTNEMKKIIGNHIDLVATCVRVPTLRGHGESVYVETEKEIDINKIKEVFNKDDYIELKDDLEKQIYPLVNECYYCKKATVGRIRKDLFSDYSLHYYIVGDNLYLGAAYNAVMILKLLLKGRECCD